MPRAKPEGRPSTYTEEIGFKICSLIGMGQSLNKICGSDDEKKNEFPHRATVYRWFSKYPSFCDNYARAKGDSADADADKVAEIAERVLDGGVDPQAARVAIDALKWMAGKKRPKKYGERITNINHDGDLEALSKDELLRKLAESEQEYSQSLLN